MVYWISVIHVSKKLQVCHKPPKNSLDDQTSPSLPYTMEEQKELYLIHKMYFQNKIFFISPLWKQPIKII